MAKFQIAFYRAAEKAGISPEQAQELVQLAEDFIVRKIEEANKNLVAELQSQRWVLGWIALLTTLSAGIAAYLATFHH